jgi:hypothetical protein
MHFSNECAKVPRVEQPCQAQTQGLVPGHVSSCCCGRNREKIGPWSIYSRCSMPPGEVSMGKVQVDSMKCEPSWI